MICHGVMCGAHYILGTDEDKIVIIIMYKQYLVHGQARSMLYVFEFTSIIIMPFHAVGRHNYKT